MAKQATVNSVPATGAVAIFELVDFLVSSLGFVQVDGSDGTTYPTTITSGAAGAGGLGNANAWVRVREAAGGGNREWVFQRDASNNTDWRVKVSALDGFSGGTPGATQVPSATDEDVILGSGTDASPTHVALFDTDGSYRWHLIGFDVAEDTVYPWYAFAAETGTGVPHTLIMVESLETGTYPALVGTRSAPTSGDSDAAVYCCRYDGGAGAENFQIFSGSGTWQDRTNPPGRCWYAMNGTNGETEALADIQASAIYYSTSFGDGGAPANTSSTDGFGIQPYSGQDQLFPTFFGRPAGLSTQVHGKGMSAHVRISGVDRSYPDTATIAGETWCYTATSGILIPFADGVTPLL